MSDSKNVLLTPFNVGKETIKNRFAVSPMLIGQCYDSRGGFSEEGIEYFVERAKGGFGMIVTGAMLCDLEVDPFDPKSSVSPLYAPSYFIRTASRLNDRCNAYGTKVFAELSLGVGRNYPGFKAPSPVEVYAYPNFKGQEITIDELHKKRDQLIKAAVIAKKAGFAGIDIHALHWGYLLDQFAMSITNQRTDEYGGSLENRLRIVKELINGIHQVCGATYPVTIGLSCKSFIKGLNQPSLTGEDEAGRTLEEAIEIAKMLEKMGFAAIMTDVGIYDSFYYACPPAYMPIGHGLKYYEQIKKNVNIPVLGRSRMGDPALCEEAVSKGQIDAVMLGRQSLADPFFPRKIETGKPEKIRPCIGCNMGCIGPLLEKGTDVGCAVNPRAVHESTTRPKKACEPRNIAVVGGGVAGMQAALTAAECGHKVEIYEKTDVLGGELNAAGAHAFKQDIQRLKNWYVSELKDLNVPVHFNTEFTPEMAKKTGVDSVIFAIGASPVMPKSIPGIEKAISAVEMLEGKKAVGENVIVVGGGMVGCETAVDLAGEGKKVTLVEALPGILSAEFLPQQQKMMLKDMLDYKKVKIMTGYKIVAVTDEGALVESVADGKQETIAADNVIMSIGLRSNPSLAENFYGEDIAVYEVGSGRKQGFVSTAVHEAFEVAYNFE